MAHRFQDLDQAGDAGGGDEVTEVRLEGPQGQITPPCEQGRAGLDLRGITNPGAGGVAFEQRDLVGRDAGHGVGRLQGAHLPLDGGGQEAAASAIVG